MNLWVICWVKMKQLPWLSDGLVVRHCERRIQKSLQIPALCLLSSIHAFYSCYWPCWPTMASVRHSATDAATVLWGDSFLQTSPLAPIFGDPRGSDLSLCTVISDGLATESSLIWVPFLDPYFLKVSQNHGRSPSMPLLNEPWLVLCSNPIIAWVFKIPYFLAEQQSSAL